MRAVAFWPQRPTATYDEKSERQNGRKCVPSCGEPDCAIKHWHRPQNSIEAYDNAGHAQQQNCGATRWGPMPERTDQPFCATTDGNGADKTKQGGPLCTRETNMAPRKSGEEASE